MGAVLVPVILIAIVFALGWLAVRSFSRREVARSDRLQSPERPTVRYQVSAGQDPAAVLQALHHAGYDASPDSEPGPSSPVVIIGTSSGEPPDREELRSVLASVGTNVVPDESAPVDRAVRFLDES